MAIITRVCLIPWCLLKDNVASCLSIILEALLRAQYNCRTDGSYLSRMCTPDLCPSSLDKYALTCAMEVQRATPIDTLSLLIHTTLKCTVMVVLLSYLDFKGSKIEEMQ